MSAGGKKSGMHGETNPDTKMSGWHFKGKKSSTVNKAMKKRANAKRRRRDKNAEEAS